MKHEHYRILYTIDTEDAGFIHHGFRGREENL